MNNEQPIIEPPIQEPIAQPEYNPGDTPVNTPENAANSPSKKKKTGMIIGIVVAVVLVVGGGFFALFMIEKAKADEREKRASAVSVNEDVELGKKEYKSSKKKTGDTEEEEEDETEEENKTASSTKKYLELSDWSVKFKYPDEVKDVKYETQDANYDGEIYITSIATDSKIYDVNICGGKVMYEQYPFFLGKVSRWDPSITHEDWQASPISEGMTLALKAGGAEYFVEQENGSGCATGDNPDYLEALRLVKLLIDNIEKK